MNLIIFFKTLLSFPKRKWDRYKKDSKYKAKLQKYGTLTKYWFDNPNIKIGEFTYGIPIIANYCDDFYVEIGNYCSVAQQVRLIVGGVHNFHCISQYAILPHLKPFFNNFEYHDRPSEPIIIGNDVWIGQGATILQGVTIGNGAVVGAKSVVAKDVPPYAMVVGNPAKIIRYRFDQETIEALQRIQWWNWPIEKIKENFNLIMSDNLKEFINKFDT